MYNHESEKRPPKFVSRKISKRVAEIRLGIENELILGDLNARRDWGFAGDYVSAMIKIVNYEIPTDFVISTGKAHSVLDFVREAFIAAGMSGEENKFLKNSPDHERKRDHRNLVGDPTKARELLNWKPSLTFSDLVHRMVKFDLAEVELRNQM
jgi:GDPmannose 4,6-dehydratase